MTASNNMQAESAWAVRTHEEMKDVLYSPESAGPAVYYYMIRGGDYKKNITILESGTVGGEYIKAYGHYHVDGLGETYTVLSGEGIVLLQERKKKDDGSFCNDEIESVKAIFISAGSVVTIPPKVGHLIINIGEGWLVTSDNSPVALTVDEKTSWPVHADYKPLKELHGFAYYVIKEDDGQIFVKNPNYKNIPEIIIEH
ncbi:MAG: glucose-6-phosphate isomerase family protein [Patescibacteria group bacterium]